MTFIACEMGQFAIDLHYITFCKSISPRICISNMMENMSNRLSNLNDFETLYSQDGQSIFDHHVLDNIQNTGTKQHCFYAITKKFGNDHLEKNDD
jgi:hypothetical protein